MFMIAAHISNSQDERQRRSWSFLIKTIFDTAKQPARAYWCTGGNMSTKSSPALCFQVPHQQQKGKDVSQTTCNSANMRMPWHRSKKCGGEGGLQLYAANASKANRFIYCMQFFMHHTHAVRCGLLGPPLCPRRHNYHAFKTATRNYSRNACFRGSDKQTRPDKTHPSPAQIGPDEIRSDQMRSNQHVQNQLLLRHQHQQWELKLLQCPKISAM